MVCASILDTYLSSLPLTTKDVLMVSDTKAAFFKRDNGSARGPDLKLYVRDVRDALGKKRPFYIKSWGTVKDAKDAIQQLTQVPVGAQRLYFGPLLTSGKELPNYRTLHDAGIYKSGEVLLLDIRPNIPYQLPGDSLAPLRLRSNDICISASLLDYTPKPLRSTIQNARRAFALGIKPDLVMDGSGGSYYIHDSKKNKIGVFKPADEEPYAENNPRGYISQPGRHGDESLRQGIAPGEACIREVAAFLLDHDGFSSVPMTTLAEARHPAFNTNGSRLKVIEGGAAVGPHSISSNQKSPEIRKVGSFQEFVRSEASMDDLSPSKLSVEQVHKIAILDIRLLNADRNPANLLCRRLPDNTLELVPIDHGYCLRSVCDVSWMDWCWLDWPQLKEPLSPKSKKYIEKLDIEYDARILRERLNVADEAIDYLRASTLVLKAGVNAGLSLYEIAAMCCRNDNLAEKPSLLEHLTSLASELSHIALENEDWHHTTASRALEEQLTPQRPGVITSRDRSSSRSFHRCASSGEFLSIGNNEEDNVLAKSALSLALERQQPSSPPMAQSSGSSDSSSDVEKDEEVEQWAHSIIEDSFQAVVPIGIRNPRSGSLSSDDGSLSSSPKGFWHVRPGSSEAALSDDEESLFSFGTSPSEEHAFIPLPMALSGPRRQSVTFSDQPISYLPSTSPSFHPPASVNVFTKDDEPRQDEEPRKDEEPRLLSLPKRATSEGMTRSRSFAALSRSFSSAGSSSSRNESSVTTRLQDYEYYRIYFLKFIDLVIAREMARRVASTS